MFFIRIDGKLSSITEIWPFFPDRGLSLPPHRHKSKQRPLADAAQTWHVLSLSFFQLGSAFSLVKIQMLCHGILQFPLSSFSTIKHLIVVTVNSVAQEGRPDAGGHSLCVLVLSVKWMTYVFIDLGRNLSEKTLPRLNLNLVTLEFWEPRGGINKSHLARHHLKRYCWTCGNYCGLTLGMEQEEKEGGITGKRDEFAWWIQLSGHPSPGKVWWCF